MKGDNMDVCILGAGIIGMSTAIQMAERLAMKGGKVTVIADKVTPHTTGDGAAGFWSPFLCGDTQPYKIREWGEATLRHMLSLSRSEDARDAGTFLITGWSIWKNKYPDPIWKDIVPHFRHLTKNELDAYPKHRYGWELTTAITECRKYLPWLTKRFISLGGSIIIKKILTFQQLADENYDVIINCTGLGAGQLCDDISVKPIKGQIMRVQAPWMKHFLNSDDDDLYIIPLSETVVLGGTHDDACWDTDVSKDQISRIFNGCCDLQPSLKKATIVEHWAGLRPGRPSIRLETELVNCSGTLLKVVHNYGHGGAGITLHWGCAKEAAELAMRLHENPQSKL